MGKTVKRYDAGWNTEMSFVGYVARPVYITVNTTATKLVAAVCHVPAKSLA